MTVTLCGLAEIQMKISLLEMRVQLMTLPIYLPTVCLMPHPLLVFRVSSAVADLASLIQGSFSKPCPSYLGICPIDNVLTHG